MTFNKEDAPLSLGQFSPSKPHRTSAMPQNRNWPTCESGCKRIGCSYYPGLPNQLARAASSSAYCRCSHSSTADMGAHAGPVLE